MKIFKKFDLKTSVILFSFPAIAFIGTPIYIAMNGIVWQEPVLLAIGWLLSGLGITVGYHRYFSHRAFRGNFIFEWLFMLLGTMAIQNTILQWCSNHRMHHKKLDTDDDPYSIKEGFFHAHMGWILEQKEFPVEGVLDLKKKPAVIFQAKYYWTITILLSFVLPLAIGFLYNRPIGALLWGVILRITLVHHFTWFINSLCHYVGNKHYDFNITARDSWYMALFTFGEGYHNFHHTFQWDYRNGIKWYDFDPSKWLIKFLSFFKITYDLKVVPEFKIFQARINTLQARINELSAKYDFSENYKNKLNDYMKKSFNQIELLEILEKKYNKFNLSELTKTELIKLNKKRKFHSLEIQNAISSIMMIIVNVKTLN